MRHIFPPRPAQPGAGSPMKTAAGQERLELLLDELNRPLSTHPTASSPTRSLRAYFGPSAQPQSECPVLASARAAATIALGCTADSAARNEADALMLQSMRITVDA